MTRLASQFYRTHPTCFALTVVLFIWGATAGIGHFPIIMGVHSGRILRWKRCLKAQLGVHKRLGLSSPLGDLGLDPPWCHLFPPYGHLKSLYIYRERARERESERERDVLGRNERNAETQKRETREGLYIFLRYCLIWVPMLQMDRSEY